MEKIKNYLFLHSCVLIFSLTGLFSKSASEAWSSGGIRNPKLYLFLLLMFLDCFIYALCWQKLMKRFPLHLGYANRSVYLIWSQLWSVLFFHEKLTARNVIGVLVILVGVVIVSLSAEQRPEQSSSH